MLLSLFGGVLADRLPRRRVLLFTQSFAMLQAAIMWILVASGTIQIWQIVVLAALLGLTNALDMPTRQAFVVEMVGREDLPNAIALNSSLFNMARIVGPGIGGLIIAWQGVAPLFLFNAISFIAVIIGLALIDLKQLHTSIQRGQVAIDAPKQSMMQSLREGLIYVWHTPAVLMIIVVVGWVSLIGINFNVVLPLFATNVLNVGPAGFGFISSAFGLGSLISALWIAWSNRKPTILFVLISAFAFCAVEAAFAISHIYALSLLMIAIVGFAQIALTATANTTVQTVAPDYLRGRVMSLYMLVFAGSIPLGNLLTGGLSDLYGASIALVIEAVISVLAVIGVWLYRNPAELYLA
jgi:MFS family permease